MAKANDGFEPNEIPAPGPGPLAVPPLLLPPPNEDDVVVAAGAGAGVNIELDVEPKLKLFVGFFTVVNDEPAMLLVPNKDPLLLFEVDPNENAPAPVVVLG